jgi:hypothetical protein
MRTVVFIFSAVSLVFHIANLSTIFRSLLISSLSTTFLLFPVSLCYISRFSVFLPEAPFRDSTSGTMSP